VRIRLQDQPRRILRSLLERPGQLVSRQELILQLWPDGTVVDYDHGLNAAVAKLRQVLLDSADEPRYIETVGRRGYRFIGAVEETPHGTPPSAHSARVRRATWTAASGLLVLLGGSGLYYYLHSESRPARSARVVPLTSYTGAQGCASFSPDGSQMAFSWRPEKEESFNLYLRMVGGGPVTRLTTEPQGRPDSVLVSGWQTDRFQPQWICFPDVAIGRTSP